MITLKTSNLTENLGFNCEDIEVKSISAAWDKIREIRNTTPAEELDGTVLAIDQNTDTPSDRIPAKILFKANKNGKIEFKDYDKVKTRQEKTEKEAVAAE